MKKIERLEPGAFIEDIHDTAGRLSSHGCGTTSPRGAARQILPKVATDGAR